MRGPPAPRPGSSPTSREGRGLGAGPPLGSSSGKPGARSRALPCQAGTGGWLDADPEGRRVAGTPTARTLGAGPSRGGRVFPAVVPLATAPSSCPHPEHSLLPLFSDHEHDAHTPSFARGSSQVLEVESDLAGGRRDRKVHGGNWGIQVAVLSSRFSVVRFRPSYLNRAEMCGSPKWMFLKLPFHHEHSQLL